MMNKNTPRYSAKYTHRIRISVHKCGLVQQNLTTVLKVISRIGMTLFPEAVTGAAL